jgi:hypothetical protein
MRPSVRLTLPTLALLGALVAAILAFWWPDAARGAQRFVSPGGADSGPCNSSPCQSFAYAYKQSSPGDVVEVAAGSYGAQTIPTVAGRSAPAVEFRPASGAQVSLGGLNVRGSFFTVRDIHTGFLDIDGQPGGQTIEGASIVNGNGDGIWIRQVRGLLIQGGAYGPVVDKPLVQIGESPTSYDITFDGVDFHDATASGNGIHMECMWAGSTIGFTVRNSIFRNCSHFDIFFTRNNGDDVTNVLLENNVFEAPKQPDGSDAPYSLNVSNWLTKMENYVIRNNVIDSDITIQPTRIVNSRIVNNIGALASCQQGVTYSHNLWTLVKCGASDRKLPSALSQFANPKGHDWHLIPGAAAVNAADPADVPATDRDGLLRNGAPDIGPYELGGLRPGGSSTAGPAASAAAAAQPRPPRLSRGRLSRTLVCARSTWSCRTTSTQLRYTLSHHARVTLKLQRVRPGRRARTVRTLRTQGRFGVNRLRLRGRGLGTPGRYRLLVSAVDANGLASATLVLRLRVR